MKKGPTIPALGGLETVPEKPGLFGATPYRISAEPLQFDQVSQMSSNSRTSRVSRSSRASGPGGGFAFGRKGQLTGGQLTLKRLGILDNKGNQVESMVAACGVLKIDIKDLEPKALDEFLKKLHDEYYDNGELEHVDLTELAQ